MTNPFDQFHPRPSRHGLHNTVREANEAGQAAVGAPHPGPIADYTGMDSPTLLNALGDDASRWATAFCQHAAKLGYGPIDEGWMIGWFANAIERSYDTRVWRSRPQARPVVAGFPLPAAPGHTDLMVPPEALEYLIAANQVPSPGRPIPFDAPEPAASRGSWEDGYRAGLEAAARWHEFHEANCYLEAKARFHRESAAAIRALSVEEAGK